LNGREHLIFNSNTGTFSPNDKTLIIANMNLLNVIGFVGPEILDSMFVTEPLVRYNFTFHSENQAELEASFVKALEMDSLLIHKGKK